MFTAAIFLTSLTYYAYPQHHLILTHEQTKCGCCYRDQLLARGGYSQLRPLFKCLIACVRSPRAHTDKIRVLLQRLLGSTWINLPISNFSITQSHTILKDGLYRLIVSPWINSLVHITRLTDYRLLLWQHFAQRGNKNFLYLGKRLQIYLKSIRKIS